MIPKKEMLQLLENRNDEILRLKEECKNYKQTIASFHGVKLEYDAVMKKMEASYKKQINELEKAVDIKKEMVNRKVREYMASIGVSTFAPEEISESSLDSPQTIFDTFKGLSGKEQAAYFKANEKVLSQLAKNAINGDGNNNKQ
jgi:hypothetical protein